MTRLGGFGIPGVGTMLSSAERNFIWGGDAGKGHVLYDSAVISGAARDAGNTPTTVLRPGLLLGKVTSTGELEEWDPAATDGTEMLAAILDPELRAQDFDANNADRFCRVVIRAPVKASQLLILGSALVGHADEYLARRLLDAAGFVFDDDVMGYKSGRRSRTIVKTADYTVTAAENGALFTTRGAAGAVNFTLPAIKRGLEFSFYNEADQNMTVTAAAADTLVTFNDLAADSVAYSTASEKIGGSFTIRPNDDASKWLVIGGLAAETQTPSVAT